MGFRQFAKPAATRHIGLWICHWFCSTSKRLLRRDGGTSGTVAERDQISQGAVVSKPLSRRCASGKCRCRALGTCTLFEADWVATKSLRRRGSRHGVRARSGSKCSSRVSSEETTPSRWTTQSYFQSFNFRPRLTIARDRG